MNDNDKDKRQPVQTGGCQCGAVRYALYAAPDGASICHCRMCQKAAGNLFGAFAGVKRENFAWTRGTPKHFNSSEVVARDFCADCGTPLTFRPLDKDRVSVAIGTLDHPEQVPIGAQYGIEARIPGFEQLAHLPAQATTDYMPPERMAKLATRQHPDHET